EHLAVERLKRERDCLFERLALGDVVLERLEAECRIRQNRDRQELGDIGDTLQAAGCLVHRQCQRTIRSADVRLAIEQQWHSILLGHLETMRLREDRYPDVVKPTLL